MSKSSRNKVMAVKARARRRWWVVGSAAAVFLTVVLIAQLTGRSTGVEQVSEPADATAPVASGSPTAAVSPAPATEFDFVRRQAGDPMAVGAVDAPVVLVEWTDLRCPFCALFSRDTWPVLMQEYVDKGLVRIEVHDVAYFGEQSEDASVAVRAAAEQGMFFEYLTAVYDAAPEGKKADLPRAELIEFARQAGISDIDRFTADLDDSTLRVAARESTTSAQQLGVGSVPFFVAGDSSLSGAQPVEVFRAFLDDALAKAG